MADRTGKLGHAEGAGLTEEEFLRKYRHQKYVKPSVTVDLVVFTVLDSDLKVLLIKRRGHPDQGKWALPGGFVDVGDGHDNQGESVEEAAHRELAEETGLPEGSCYLEQLFTFGKPYRDPRMRVITVAYYALVSSDQVARTRAGDDAAEAKWFSVASEVPNLDLAFDHEDILRVAVERIRGKLDYCPLAFELVPETFTITELRAVHEAVKGETYDNANFRRRFKRMQTDGIIEQAPGMRQTTTRPAKVYRFIR